MNPGILPPPTQYATMPRGLLGRPTPVPMPGSRVVIDPRDVAGCTGWWDASDASTLTLNGSNVSAWINRGAAGGAYFQTTASRQPPVTRINGLNAITFSGIQLLGSGPAIWQLANARSNTLYAFMVVQQPANGATVRFWGTPGNSGGGNFGLYVRLVGLVFWDCPEATARVSGTTPFASSPTVARFVRDGTTAAFFRNGRVGATRSDASGAIPNSSTQLGYDNAANNNVTTIAELITYNQAPAADMIQAIEQYLMQKWGITVP